MNVAHAPSGEGRPTPKVYVIDDDDLLRRSLKNLFEAAEIECRAYSRPDEFLEEFPEDVRPFGCLVVDIQMPGMSGLALVESLRWRWPDLQKIILTAHADLKSAVRALRAGAADFFEKPYNGQELVDRVRDLLREEERMIDLLGEKAKVRRRYHKLTERERHVVKLLVDGMSNKEVAHELGVSMRTVESHRASACKKLEADRFPEIVRMWTLLEDERPTAHAGQSARRF